MIKITKRTKRCFFKVHGGREAFSLVKLNRMQQDLNNNRYYRHPGGRLGRRNIIVLSGHELQQSSNSRHKRHQDKKSNRMVNNSQTTAKVSRDFTSRPTYASTK